MRRGPAPTGCCCSWSWWWFSGCSRAVSRVQRSICMGQAAHGCCSGSRPAPAGAARPAAARCCSGLLQPARVRCSGAGKRAEGALQQLHNIADLRCSDEIYARLLHAAPCVRVCRPTALFGGAAATQPWHQRHPAVRLPVGFPQRGTMYARAGAAAVCSGEPEQTGLPGATGRPRHTPLTCWFPLEGNDVRTGCSSPGAGECAPGAHSCASGAHSTVGYHPEVMAGGISQRRARLGAVGPGAWAGRSRTAGR